MKLYIGGAYQGQEELAGRENPGAEFFFAWHEKVRSLLEEGVDPLAYTETFCKEHPQAVVTADEVGCGLVPMEARERAFREAAGRALCCIAAHCDTVTRVSCGIGMRIK
ncbi:MAG: bifunctional adenosylcobinamide kinase/adenosylcobinamide-phosphate guanylyltransferase [Clostridia bacterium]|nr:bifunctional adenosylcobinamide kinase/adenosylcobinamide-phosphate guanylyltransferase [Clostridia bacterium]